MLLVQDKHDVLWLVQSSGKVQEMDFRQKFIFDNNSEKLLTWTENDDKITGNALIKKGKKIGTLVASWETNPYRPNVLNKDLWVKAKSKWVGKEALTLEEIRWMGLKSK